MTRFVVCLLSCLVWPSPPHQQVAAGVIVEQVAGVAAKAGLQPGDVLLRWSAGLQSGTLTSPFDIVAVETEYAPRGSVRVIGERQGTEHDWLLEREPWTLTVRPVLDDAALAAYEAGGALAVDGRVDEAVRRWDEALARSSGDARAWLHALVAQRMVQSQRWEEAERRFAAANGSDRSTVAAIAVHRAWGAMCLQRSDWTCAEGHFTAALGFARSQNPDSLLEASILVQLAGVFGNRDDTVQAVRLFSDAEAIHRRHAPESLGHALSLQGLGMAANTRQDFDAARKYHQAALDIRERLVPGGVDVGQSLFNLGRIAHDLGDLETAEALYGRALSTFADPNANMLLWSNVMNNMGNILRARGDFRRAQQHYGQAIAVREKLMPGSLLVAGTLTNMGHVLTQRGDFVQAEDHYRRALAIREKLAPGGSQHALSLEALGMLFNRRRDYVKAEQYFQDALKLTQAFAPASISTARIVNNLGTVAETRGDVELAAARYEEALNVRRQQGAAPTIIAESLHNIGVIHELRGRLREAREAYLGTLAAYRERSDGSLEVAQILFNLGDVARKERQWTQARAYYEEGLTIRTQLAPDSSERAYSLHALGLLARETNDPVTAERYWTQALEVLDAHARRFGGPEDSRATFGSQVTGFYLDYIDLLLKHNRTADAFQVLERSRARVLLGIMAERDIAFADVPADLDEQRRVNAAAYDGVQSELASLSARGNTETITALRSKLNQISAERAHILDKIRAASPRVADATAPVPVSLAAARATLDPDTIILSYLVRDDDTVLFVVPAAQPAGEVSVLNLPIGRAKLNQSVDAFRRAINQRTASSREDTRARSRQLYDLLIRPAERILGGAARVLLIPDGPLHLLPFAALQRPSGQYLIEWKPLHLALSATVYAEIRKRPRWAEGTSTSTFIAFGDPDYASQVGMMVSTPRSAQPERRPAGLERLRFSREEVETIANLLGKGALTFLGGEASETRAKSVGQDARYLHFAVHGLIDGDLPLNSALAFSAPEKDGEDNGLLQAWELYEHVRWNADLVTLSACETALGREYAGEGLMGLTHAIQFAGARSVLSSLWNVDDRRTALLMKAFYTHLRQGLAKDDALRAAQLEMIRSPLNASPAHWASFALHGDRR